MAPEKILEILKNASIGSTTADGTGFETTLTHKNATTIKLSYDSAELRDHLSSLQNNQQERVHETAGKTRSRALQLLVKVSKAITSNPFDLGRPARPPPLPARASTADEPVVLKQRTTVRFVESNIQLPQTQAPKPTVDYEAKAKASLSQILGDEEANRILPHFLQRSPSAQKAAELLEKFPTICQEVGITPQNVLDHIRRESNGKEPSVAAGMLHKFLVGGQALSRAPSDPSAFSESAFSERLNMQERFRRPADSSDKRLGNAYKSSSDAKKAVSQAAETFDTAFKIAFGAVRPHELHQQNWLKKNKEELSPNVVAYSQLMNATTLYFATKIIDAGMKAGSLPEPGEIDPLTGWATRPKISQSKETNAQDATVRMWEVTVETAHRLYEMNNFSASMAVFSALEMNAVDRLRISNSDTIDPEVKRKFDELKKTFSPDAKFANLRLQERERQGVPALNLVQADLMAGDENVDQSENKTGALIHYGGILTDFTERQRNVGQVAAAPNTNLAEQALQNMPADLNAAYETLRQRSRMIFVPKPAT